jgi:cytoskeletal protein CcmA (bactofilin family)
MAETTVIGRASHVSGRVNGSGDLEIAGHVEGDITITGEVTVESSGLVAANISARRIVVRGAVKGDLTADDALLLESGARVVGDLRAPKISVAQGGLVRGHVQTGAAGAAKPRAASASARATVPSATAAKLPAKSVPKAAPSRPAVTASKNNGKPAAHRGSTLAGARPGPPPPVVPALKKGTKAVHKKR